MAQADRFLSIFWLTAVLLIGCSEPPEKLAEPVVDPLAHLTDTPPADGMCAGWRKSLAKGARVSDVEQCLREKALRDRPGAVKEAEVMLGWQIKEGHHSQLKVLVATLSSYPEPGSLKRYLAAHALLPNKPGEYSRLDTALTVSDYVTELGNIYWFDAETGTFPNNHDHLLAEVAALSGLKEARFTEKPPTDYDAEDEPYLLNATFKGKSYQQVAKNYGDWYDIGAVLMLLNRIAVDQAINSRFVTLPTGDQTATVWTVDNEKLTQLQAEGLIRLSAAEVSMQTGKAFEEEVRKHLDNVQ